MATPTRVIAAVIAYHAGVVRVTRAGLRRERSIVARALVGVLDERADGCAGSLAVINAGLDDRRVGFLALGGLLIATGRAALHFAQHKSLIVLYACRETVDHNADTGTV